MRILVCGGRDYRNNARVSEVLDAINAKFGPLTIIHGAAKGADTLAGVWALQNNCQVLRFPAKWSLYGPAAGPIRNTEMLERGDPALVVAFPGGRGTANMVEQAMARGLHVVKVEG